MEAPMAIGTKVQQVVTPIRGVVKDVRFDAPTLSFYYEVEYQDAGGYTHSRWFAAGEVVKGDA